MLKYIELKTGYDDNGPAWIARVKVSKSGRTLYFDRKALKPAGGLGSGNYIDVETREEYWVSGVKRRGTNRHCAGSGTILVEEVAVAEFLRLVGEPSLDSRYFEVTRSIRPTEPADFITRENLPLHGR